ncbi:MAG: hypothetical protein HOQ02_04285 [Lysobacter sp.]|nr:hypothetical protein [Lysobacter sp.]
MIRNCLVAALCGAAFLAPAAHAGEPVFGWIYTTDTHPKGTSEIEQHVFLQQGQSQGEYSNWQFRTEYEYGVTDNYQVSVYLNSRYVHARRNGVDGRTGGPDTDFDDSFDTLRSYNKFRVETVSFENIWRLKNPFTDGYGLALYVEPEIGPHERELETRLILQKNFLDDTLIVAGNLMAAVEREEGAASGEVEKATMIDLTAGVTYHFASHWSAGLEARNHREFAGYGLGNKEHSAWFLGPNVHYATQDWWITAAWRHQLPVVQAFNEEQRAATVGDRIYGGEHARNEFIVKFGVPLQ